MKITEEKIIFSEYKWYIIQTYNTIKARVVFANDEKLKSKKLQALINKYELSEYFNEIFVPLIEKKNVMTGEMQEINLAPGYIFIHMILNDKTKNFLLGSKTGFLIGGYNNPKEVTQEEIDRLKKNIALKEQQEQNFYVGESIKIKNRDFVDFDGIITELLPDNYANVSISIFGRNTIIKFKLTDLEKII